MRLSTRSLTILYLDSMTSEFEKKKNLNIYIYSSDQAFEMAMRKGAFIGFSNLEISAILSNFYLTNREALTVLCSVIKHLGSG